MYYYSLIAIMNRPTEIYPNWLRVLRHFPTAVHAPMRTLTRAHTERTRHIDSVFQNRIINTFSVLFIFFFFSEDLILNVSRRRLVYWIFFPLRDPIC